MYNPSKRIKLAVDTHHLKQEFAGTKRVTVNLISQFKKMDNIDLTELQPFYPLIRGKGMAAKILGHMVRFFWVHIHLPLLCYYKKIDILLSPEFNTPLLTSCKRVVIAHDAHMRAQKQFTSAIWFYCYYIPFIETAIRKADLIFTVSEFAKKQVAEQMHIAANKIFVAYNGIDERFTDSNHNSLPTSSISKKGLRYKEYLLFVGTFEARKNIERLIEAFALFKKKYAVRFKNVKLAIVGNTASSKFSDRSKQISDLIDKLDIKSDIILCGYVPDAELPDFYKGASLIAFPSLNEGFGFPIIEGFASEVPVLTSNTCSMPEIAGNAALLVDPYNIVDIAEKIELLMADLPLRDRLVLAGKERVRSFTWERCAGKIISKIQELLIK